MVAYPDWYSTLNKTQRRRYDICVRDGWRCWYCGVDLSGFRDDVASFKRNAWGIPTVDHFIPKVRGGTDEPENLACCCWNCNVTKGSKSIEEFRHYLAYGKTNIKKAIEHLREAIQLWPTPFDETIEKAASWIHQQAPQIVFYGERKREDS